MAIINPYLHNALHLLNACDSIVSLHFNTAHAGCRPRSGHNAVTSSVARYTIQICK